MMHNNVLNIGVNNWWKGYELIVIDEVAGTISQDFLNVLLSRCQQSSATVELCVFSGEDRQRLSVAFILRCAGDSRYTVQGTLNDLVQALLPQFEENGFRVHLAGKGDEVQKNIDRFFGGDQSHYNVGRGFFSEDKLLGPKNYYVPGRYTAEECLPISWEQLARTITRYPMSMMCIQLLSTQLDSSETAFLEKQKKYFANLLNPANNPGASNQTPPSGGMMDIYAEQARMLYEQLLTLRGKPLFFANVFCTGSVLFAEDVTALMRTWKYKAFTLPPQELQKPNYFIFGDSRIKACTTQYGHMKALVHRLPNDPAIFGLTHLITPENVLGLFPLPRETAGIPGLRVKRYFPSPVLIPEASCYKENARMIYLGRQEGTDIRFGMRLGDLRRHGFIVGKSGCGKTTFAMGLLHQLNQMGIPFLVVEPAKCEYRSLLPVIKDLKIYTPGLSSVSPIQLNPFMPPKNVTLEEYLPALSTIFSAAISMDHPLDVILPQVIRICYTNHGWRSTSTRDSKGAKPFGMTEFIRCYQDYIRERYTENAETRGDLEAGGVVRLMQLITEYPLLFDTNNALDFEEIFKHPTIIELDAIRNDQQRSLIMMTILVQAQLCIQQRSTMDSSLKNVIMIDEAHLLLGGNGAQRRDDALDSSIPCIRYLQDMVKILRSYGTGIFFGDQSPEKLTDEIMEHVNLKIMFKQDSPENRAILGALTRMDNEMQEDMIDLPPGCGYVFLDAGLDKPVKVYAPHYKEELDLREDVSNAEIAQMMRMEIAAPFSQCAACKSCANRCNLTLRSDAKYVADRIVNSPAFSAILGVENQPGVLSDPIPAMSKASAPQQEKQMRAYFKDTFAADVAACLDEQDIRWPDRQQLLDCVKIQMIRGLLLDSSCVLTERALLKMLEPEEEKPAAETNAAPSTEVRKPERKLGVQQGQTSQPAQVIRTVPQGQPIPAEISVLTAAPVPTNSAPAQSETANAEQGKNGAVSKSSQDKK